MDQLPALGTSIADVVLPTMKIYAPLLQRNAAAIKSTPSKTYTYGPHERHQLDVYYPPEASEQNTHDSPILVFLYGGGLIRGGRILPMYPDGLAYYNIGHFFAKKYGYTVVIPDYRLISHGAQFPSGGVDLELVIAWAEENLTGSVPRCLYLMGNSAGGIHLATYLFVPQFEESRKRILAFDSALRLHAVVLQSVPFRWRRGDPSRQKILDAYYGNLYEENSPLGLLSAMTRESTISTSLPGVKILVLNGTLDPEDEILEPMRDFVHLIQESGNGKTVTADMMKGHNHISPPQSLGTDRPKEEAWGHRVATFFMARESAARL